MKIKVLLLTLLSTLAVVNLSAQEMPLVYEVENTGADSPVPYLPSFEELPVVETLPDPFQWSDGRDRIENFSDWRYRRAEIKAEIEYYEIGEKPARPDTITASYSDSILTVNITVNGKTLTLSSQVILPSGEGPFPAVIGMNSPSGSIPEDVLTSRDIARITYNHNQVTTYGSQQNSDPYYQLYPHLNATNTGQYSAWAWGVSRIIDGLELVQDDLPIDLKHIAVTGCSYAGKMALFSGAFDERIALTISVESGGGGYTTWRFSETLGNVERLGSTDHNWFKEYMWQFSNAVHKLPHDHHELMAMVAPRALLVTGNPDYTWLADESGHVGSNAAKEVWKALGVPDRFGFSIVAGHPHCLIPESQMPEVEAFIDKFLLGKDTVNTNIATTPYNTNLSPWINWSIPELSSDTTYFTKLIYPTDAQNGLNTEITFQWNKVHEAEKYFIEVATDPAFTTIEKSDSTISDTSITLTGFSESKKYYWRVQVQNPAGLGPWSSRRSFVTTLSLPAEPSLISSTTHRTGYITLTWHKVNNAAQYLIQISREQNFNNIFKSISTPDTVKNVSWFSEGQKYYWRIRAKNLAGSGTWSDVWNFTLVNTPTDLVVEKSASNEITLTWEDESNKENGYIVERKEVPQTFFTVIDTLEEDSNLYVDKNVKTGLSYTYRVKAYNDSAESGYSNEASLVLTDVDDEVLPTEYSISQNYPNPFNPATNIKFDLPKSGKTKITVYDLLGRELKTLIDQNLDAGYHEISIDASNFQSGVYFYRIQSGDFIQTKKMVLIK